MWYRSFIIVALLLASSYIPSYCADEPKIATETFHFSFQPPNISDMGEYLSVELPGANSCIYEPGIPIIPFATKTLDLPFGTKIRDIVIDVNAEPLINIDKPIQPAPQPYQLEPIIKEQRYIKESLIYESDQPFPNNWYDFKLNAGLNEYNEHISKLTLLLFPLRFTPHENCLEYAKRISITIFYELPISTPFPKFISYDMVIITPLRFVKPLQLLAQHKNNHGIYTIIKPVHEIYWQYNGIDKPEQIKYFIKHAIEAWGIQYVLLVGGLKSMIYGSPRDDLNQGTLDWFIPVRYTNLKENDTVFDPGFISDLYYADIYDAEGNFSSWDPNDDGVFGKWSNDPDHQYDTNNPGIIGNQNVPPIDTDIIDFYPDIHLGRLPCRNLAEVKIMVSKIITYETLPADPSWFNRMVVVGGDPYDDVGTNIIEGEEICDKALEHMSDFEGITLYASNKHDDLRNTPLSRNIIREINKGCGYLLLDGHGSPGWWNTFWPYQFDSLIANGGLSIYQIPLLLNGRRLPICVIGGCHNLMFNISLIPSILDKNNARKMWSYGLPIPECWGWALTSKANGGAIATIGSTGLGYEADGEHGDIDGDGVVEPDCVEVLGGYLATEFFDILSDNVLYLGDAWGGAITRYLEQHPAFINQSYAKTIEQWVLIGDPSLRIGGYC